jgi:uncharacterized protein YgiM (DUF1202 family)
MKTMSRITLTFFLLLAVATVYAKGVVVGATVELKAKKKAGVPLHKEAKSSMFARAPHGSKATVMEVRKSWYRIKLSDGKIGWVTRRYIAKGKSKK